ncbi:unnamed protein product [Rhodiola kirilowii]
MQNLKSDLSFVATGNIASRPIAFHGYVRIIDPFWHMLGLGYQENTSVCGGEKCWGDTFQWKSKGHGLTSLFQRLKPLWAKYVNSTDRFIRSCHINLS